MKKNYKHLDVNGVMTPIFKTVKPTNDQKQDKTVKDFFKNVLNNYDFLKLKLQKQRLNYLRNYLSMHYISEKENKIGDYICYMYIFHINNKELVYIGQSCSNNRYNNFSSYKSQLVWKMAMQYCKKPEDCESYILCKGATTTDADQIEDAIIELLDSRNNKDHGLNVARGGKSMDNISECKKSKYVVSCFRDNGAWCKRWASLSDLSKEFNIPYMTLMGMAGKKHVYAIRNGKSDEIVYMHISKKFQNHINLEKYELYRPSLKILEYNEDGKVINNFGSIKKAAEYYDTTYQYIYSIAQPERVGKKNKLNKTLEIYY